MDIKQVSKGKGRLEFKLRGEGRTMAELIKGLSWKHKGEAVYNKEHPLVGDPVIRVKAKSPKSVLKKVSKDIIRLSTDLEKAFE